MSPRILITGAGGQVGWELVRQAAARGWQPLAFARQQLDVTDRSAVHGICSAQRPDIIINAAAYTAVDRAEDEPGLAHAINTDGVGHLADAAKSLQVPLLHISTDYVFDGAGSRPWQETDAVAPLGVYGASKAEGERQLRERLDCHVIVRTSWVFGVHGNNFAKTILRLANERDELRVIDDQHGAPTFAGHIAGCLLECAARHFDGRPLPWGTYHFAGAPDTTWYGFARAIFDLAVERGLLTRSPTLTPITTDQYPLKAMRPKNSRLDCTRLHTQLAVETDWRAGVLAVLAATAQRPGKG